jgi:hypothetical protein
LLGIIHRIPSVDTAQWEQYTLLHGRCDASVVAHQAVVRRSGVRIRYLPSLRLTVVSRRVATWDDIWRWICPLAGDEEEKLGKIAKKQKTTKLSSSCGWLAMCSMEPHWPEFSESTYN